MRPAHTPPEDGCALDAQVAQSPGADGQRRARACLSRGPSCSRSSSVPVPGRACALGGPFWPVHSDLPNSVYLGTGGAGPGATAAVHHEALTHPRKVTAPRHFQKHGCSPPRRRPSTEGQAEFPLARSPVAKGRAQGVHPDPAGRAGRGAASRPEDGPSLQPRPSHPPAPQLLLPVLPGHDLGGCRPTGPGRAPAVTGQ